MATKDENDPKHLLRALCAQHGMSTQFIFHLPHQGKGATPSKGIAPGLRSRLRKAKTEESDPTVDYPAINSLIDATRGTGYPLHAARQIAEDHPVAEKLRKGRF